MNIIKSYKEKYILERDVQNEIAQKNFTTVRMFSCFVIVFSLINILCYIFFNLHDIPSVTTRIIYFGGFFLLSSILLLYCKIVENCDREKNRIIKNIPFYLITAINQVFALYNFFVFETPLNGLLYFEIVNFVSLLLYDYDPLLYLPNFVIPFVIMIPTLSAEYETSTIADIILFTAIILYYTFYKRKRLKKHYDMLKNQKQILKIITFGNFTMLFNNTVVKFRRKKSLELIAYLIYKKGSSVDSKELMCVLYGERATSSTYGSYIRNLIVDIKQTFKQLNIHDFFIAEYNSFRINPSIVECDYYNFLDNTDDGKKSFSGEFMNQFSWAEDTAAYLETMAIKK